MLKSGITLPKLVLKTLKEYCKDNEHLGVVFDQKLQWSDHIAHCIQKSSKALTAIRLIRNFFNTKEILQLITSNFYSVLYYSFRKTLSRGMAWLPFQKS